MLIDTGMERIEQPCQKNPGGISAGVCEVQPGKQGTRVVSNPHEAGKPVASAIMMPSVQSVRACRAAGVAAEVPKGCRYGQLDSRCPRRVGPGCAGDALPFEVSMGRGPVPRPFRFLRVSRHEFAHLLTVAHMC